MGGDDGGSKGCLAARLIKSDGADGELITTDDARCEVIPTAQKGQASGGGWKGWEERGKNRGVLPKPDASQDTWKNGN